MEQNHQIDALRRENEELRAAVAHQAERARRFARLRGLTARLAASLDRAAIFDEIVLIAADLFKAEAAALLLVGAPSQEVMVVETQQGLRQRSGTQLPTESSLARRALEQRHAIAMADAALEPGIVTPSLADGTRPGALIVAPIRVESRPFGVVEVYYREARPIPSEDVEMLEALSDAAAIALRNATAYARILEQGSELARRNDELARQKEELARLNSELRQADVLKSQFLSTISHELRTPLTSVIGFSALLLRERKGESLSDRQRDNVERILSSARHLVTLINDILDLSRIEAGRLDIFRRVVRLPELMESVRADLEPQAREKDLTLHLEIDDDLEPINTDADRLRQVLINLVDNAIKFTFQGGITIRAEQSGETVLITVQDTGVGIPFDQQERIFDEFYQIDQSSTRMAGGTGLGLAISRRLVVLLDGRLTLQSRPGEGSTFTIVLPTKLAAHAVAGPSGAVKVKSQGEAARVLVIDDDPDMILLLEWILEGSPYEVIGALSANDGLKKAVELQPDAILLDVMMPETDGWRALHRLKSDPRVAHIPVVMHTIVADQALGFSLGATDYLVKPVERDQLLDVLGRLTPLDAGPILVVDDDENIRSLLVSILTEEGMSVTMAASGADALRQIAERTPRLVVLDLMMPGLDGFEVLHRLRSNERTKHIPVVVVTAKALTPGEEHVLRSEASMIVTKSGVPLERLLDEIRSALKAVS